MDAFYASIEQRDRPELRGKPVIVGATSPRSVVSAASYEARKFGVKSAMPGFRARELCPDGVFLPSDMEKYARVSAQIQRIFEDFTPLVEPLALDEAFLDVTGSLGLFGGPVALGRELKARVKRETDLPVSCGIAENKLVAKIACSLGKPDGLYHVPREQTRQVLDPLPASFLWGVGPVLERALAQAGLLRIGDIADAELSVLRRVVGNRAEELRALARGQDDRPVVPEREAKSYGEENTFAEDVTSRETITAALTSHAHAVAARIRHDGLRARTVVLKVKLGRARGRRRSRTEGEAGEPSYPLFTRSRTLAEPTDDAARIRGVVIELWQNARFTEPIRLLGVTLSGLSPGERVQLSLFDDQRRTQPDKLGPALDAIRKRFGEAAIQVAVQAPEKLTPSDHKKRGQSTDAATGKRPKPRG